MTAPTVPATHGPTVFHVENTTGCNLYCRHCTRVLPDYQVDIMPWSIYERLLWPMKKYRPLVLLNGHGEPLTHHDFKRQFLAAAEMGCNVRFQTNGQRLTEHLTADLLATGAWDRLDVSIDAASDGLYAEIRVGGTMDRLRKNMLDFRRLRGNGDKPPAPLLNVEFVAMRRNVHELPAVVKLAGEFGAVSLLVTELTETPQFRGETIADGDVQRLLAPAAEEAIKAGAAAGVRIDFTRGLAKAIGHDTQWGPAAADGGDNGQVCQTPWHVAYIRADGRIQPCCRLAMAMGDLNETPFDDIWNGEAWSKLRADIEAGNPPQQCRECNWV